MADDDQVLPSHFSSFDTSLPASFSNVGQDTMQRPEDKQIGQGLSGIPSIPATWADVGHYAAAGAHELAATGAGFAAGMSGTPETEAGWKRTAAQQQLSAEESRAAATPTAQPGWGHPMLWAAEQAPGLAALAVPAAAATAVAGPAGGAAVLGTVMGAQTEGDVYNRLTGEGVEPTFQQKTGAFALGAASGLAMDLTGGAAKIAVSPIVGKALGVGGDAVVFGAQSGAQEYTAQKAEIAAGKRTDTDTGAILGATESGAATGLGFGVGRIFRRGEKPPAPPADIPAIDAGTGRDLTQTPGAAHVERTSPETKATEVKEKAPVAPDGAGASPPAPPSSPVGDPSIKAAADAAAGKPTQQSKDQPGVAQPLPQPKPPIPQPGPVGAEAPEKPAGGPPAAEAAPPPPPPTAPPAPQPPPPDPAVIAQQHAELIDPAHPRDAMIYPKGVEVPNTTTLPEGWRYGKVKLPGDQGTALYNHSPTGSGWRRDAVKAAAQDGTLAGKIEARAAEPPKPESVAGAQPAAAAEAGVEAAPAAAAEAAAGQTMGDRFAQIRAEIKARQEAVQAAAAARRGEAPQPPEVVQKPTVEPTVAPTPESKPSGPELLTENKAGVKLYRNPDPEGKPYLKVAPGGEPMPMGEETAKLLFHEYFGAEAYTGGAKSEAEAIRERADQAGRETKGRVLRSETDEEKAAAARQSEADAAAAARVETEKGEPPKVKPIKPKEEVKAGKKSPEVIEHQKRMNAVANDVVDRNQPATDEARNKETLAVDPSQAGGKGARAALLARVKKMLEDAKTSKFEFMKRAMHRTDEDTRHSNKSLILYEAKLLDGAKAADKDYGRFLANENDLLHNGQDAYERVLNLRKESGKETAAQRGKPTGEAQGVEDIEKAGAPEAGSIEKPDVAEEYEAAKERVAEEEVAKAPGEERKLTENERRAQEASERARARLAEQEAAEKAGARERPTVTHESEGERAAPTTTAGFKQVGEVKVEKRRTIVKPKNAFIEDVRTPEEIREANREFFRKHLGMTDEELDRMEEEQKQVLAKMAEEKPPTPEEEKTLQVPNRQKDPDHINMPTDKGWVRLKVRSNSNIRDMLTKIAAEVRASGFATGEVAHAFLQRLIDLVGDVPVRYVSKKELYKFAALDGNDNPRRTRPGGFYSFDTHQIVLSDQLKSRAYTVHASFHEAIHAATSVALDRFPEFKDRIRQIMDAAYWHTDVTGEEYAFTNEHEFVAEIFSNEHLREYLAEQNIPNELKKQTDYAAWRKLTGFKRALKTLWDLTALAIGKVLRLPPRGVSYLEATLAATEEYMGKHAEDVASGMPIRFIKGEEKGARYLQQRPAERDQEAAVRSHRETLSRVRDIDAQVMKQYGKDTIHNLGGSIMKGTAKLLSGTWLDDVHGHLFSDAKGSILQAINDAQNRVSHMYSTLMGKDKDLLNRGYFLDRTYASQMANYARLVDMSVRYNIHADREGAKPPKNLWDAARSAWQQFKYGDEARALYDHLPEELQKRYTAEKKYYMDKQGDMGKILLNQILPMFDAPKGRTSEEIMNLARDNKMEDSDWTHYQKLGVADILHEAYRLQTKKDVYFNSVRGDGRFVVSGRYAMPKGGKEVDYSGSELRDDTREFDSEQEAHAFATNTRMKSTTHEVNYHKDPASGEIKRVSGEEAASVGTVTPRYQVRLERQNYQVADSRAEARRNRQAMEADGVGELTGVMDKRDERAWSDLNTADQKLLEKKIDSNPNMTPFEKQQMKDATRQMMLSSRGGMGAHMIAARKVAGARFDSAAGLHAYARAINFHIARNSHAPALSDAMDRLDAHEKANRASDPDNALRRSIVSNEYMNRVYGRDASPMGAKSSPLMHRLMTWAFVNFLARPSHIILSQIHPYIYSVPMLAARHGYWKSVQGQRQAMRDLGGMGHNLWEGAKAGYQVYKSGGEQNIDKATAMARGVDPILRMVNGLKDKGERDAMMRLWETEHLHSAFDASVFEGNGQDRMNAVIRQFTDAMEANNRLSTALNAYRLEKGMHKDPANALAYSRRVIEQTHGVFSPTNAASVFKNPIVRPIMQFRQQPMNLAIMMYRNIGKSLPEKWGGAGDNEARWTLAYQLGTAAALGGMGGMPMDLPKLAGLAGQAAGGPAPSDWDDKFYRMLVDNLGPTAAKAIHDGIPGMMGPFGPSLGHRTGFDAGLVFGEPKSNSAGDELAFIAKQLAGASVGMGMDWLDALHSAEQGNWERAGENLMPGSLRDLLKAYRNATEGQMAGKEQVEPPSFGKEILQGLGFSSVESERMLAGHYALQKAVKAEQTVQDQLKAKHAARGQSVLGVKVPKKERALGEEYEGAYQ